MDTIEMRDRVKVREWYYRDKTHKEVKAKLKYVIFSVIPALIRAAFDPTVRSIDVQICRPPRWVVDDKDISVQKVMYLEDLYRMEL